MNYNGVNYRIELPIPLPEESAQQWVTKVHKACEVCCNLPAIKQKLFARNLWPGQLCYGSINLSKVRAKLTKANAKPKMYNLRMVGFNGSLNLPNTGSTDTEDTVNASSWLLPSVRMHASIFALTAGITLTAVLLRYFK